MTECAKIFGGVSLNTAKSYLTGDVPPTSIELENVVAFTGCDAQWLLMGVPERSPGADPSETDEIPAFRVAESNGREGVAVRVTVYKCSVCRGQVEKGAEICPHCRTLLTWSSSNKPRESA